MQARKNLENCIVNEIHKKLSEKLGEVQEVSRRTEPLLKGNDRNQLSTKLGEENKAETEVEVSANRNSTTPA